MKSDILRCTSRIAAKTSGNSRPCMGPCFPAVRAETCHRAGRRCPHRGPECQARSSGANEASFARPRLASGLVTRSTALAQGELVAPSRSYSSSASTTAGGPPKRCATAVMLETLTSGLAAVREPRLVRERFEEEMRALVRATSVTFRVDGEDRRCPNVVVYRSPGFCRSSRARGSRPRSIRHGRSTTVRVRCWRRAHRWPVCCWRWSEPMAAGRWHRREAAATAPHP